MAQPPKRDSYRPPADGPDIRKQLFDRLRTARLDRQLTQQELAGKLGLRQRQISDLERAAMDPRLSTVQNVARALDLELMLVPRHLISLIEGLERAGSTAERQPMYTIDDDEERLDASTDRAAADRRRGAAKGGS
jgi:transcriptional regulator with XRE-family HTH domain